MISRRLDPEHDNRCKCATTRSLRQGKCLRELLGSLDCDLVPEASCSPLFATSASSALISLPLETATSHFFVPCRGIGAW